MVSLFASYIGRFSTCTRSVLEAAGGLGNFMNESLKASHKISQLGRSTVGATITLCGWVQHIRHINSGSTFMIIRDYSGRTVQALVDPRTCSDQVPAHALKEESIISIRGVFLTRPAKDINANEFCGEYEIKVDQMHVLNKASRLEFNPFHATKLPDENLRMAARFLDLRRPQLRSNLITRHNVCQTIRNYLSQDGFLEIETPLLFKSTPEGAQEFLVPSNKLSNSSAMMYYALPQSPQQFKQMLMAAGFEKYFQIAKCFRNEDLRSDRQPEFTQVDLEMAFVTETDVISTVTRLVESILKLVNRLQDASWSTMTFKEAQSYYGTDKPDLRFSNKLVPLETRGNCAIEALIIREHDVPTDSEFGFDVPKHHFANTMHQLEISTGNDGPLIKTNRNFHPELKNYCNSDADVVIVCERDVQDHVGTTAIGNLRLELIKWLKALDICRMDDARLKFLWINQFPLLKRAVGVDAYTGRIYESVHHPFTAPLQDHVSWLETRPLDVVGQHYDLVLNGVEIGGGSIRIHSAELQEFLLTNVMQLKPEVVEQFRHLLDALASGCPPHGGIALGLDRLIAMLVGANSIRDVIAFPKNGSGIDLCVKAPSIIEY